MKNDGRGIAQYLDDNPVKNTTLTSAHIEELIKQVFTGNIGPEKRWLIYFGTKRELKKFLKNITPRNV